MAEYNGTIELISGITPKNNGAFPLVNAEDVLMPDGTRLSEFELHATDEQISTAVETWLNEHPEVTTTVTDGSITKEKLSPDLLYKIYEDGINSTAIALLITILRNGVYTNNQSANITALEAALAEGGSDAPPDEPVVPDTPEKTLTSISATYSGGEVPVGTAVTALTGVVVTAHYSDGSTETVTDYTLSGTISEGSNTVTVSYGGKTAAFTVTGVAESDDDIPADATRLAYIESTGTQYIDTGVKPAFLNEMALVIDVDENVGSQADIFGAYDGTTEAYFRYYQTATVGKFGWLGGASNFTCADHLGESMALTTWISPNNVTIHLGTQEDDGNSTLAKSTVADISVVSGVNLYLFARNNNGDASRFASFKLREFVLYETENVGGSYQKANEIIHLIPVRDPEGVVCLYDTVGKQYLYNSGTGNFVGGEN